MKMDFTEEDVNGNKHRKRCSASIANGEMQVKTTVRSHHTPLRTANKNINSSTKYQQRCRKTVFIEQLVRI